MRNPKCRHTETFVADVMVKECRECHEVIDHPWMAEIERLRAALKVAQQSILEFRHAQECGPSWYTGGANGMYQQVYMHLRRGLDAVQAALGPYDDSGVYEKEKAR